MILIQPIKKNSLYWLVIILYQQLLIISNVFIGLYRPTSYLAATKAPIIIANTVILIPQEKVFLQKKKYILIHTCGFIHTDFILQAKKKCFLWKKAINNNILSVSKELDI